MRRAGVIAAVVLLAAPALAQPTAAPPQGEPDAAADPIGARIPGPAIEPRAPTDAYDARVRQSFAAAESFQGPLDGGWTLSAVGDGALYDIRFADREGRLEAVWRDLRRPGALDSSGVVDFAQRAGARLTFGFSPAAGAHVFASLSAGPGAIWTGDLDENGRKRKVTLTKTSP